MSVPISLEVSGACSDGEAIVVDGDLPNLRCEPKAEPQAPVPPKVIKQTTVVERPYRVTVTKNPSYWWAWALAAVLFLAFYRFKRFGPGRKRVDIHHHKD